NGVAHRIEISARHTEAGAGPISIHHDAICDLTLLVRGHLHYPASSEPVHIRTVPSVHAIACSCSRIAIGSKRYLLSRAKVRIKQEQEIEDSKEGVLSHIAARPHTEDTIHGSTLNSRHVPVWGATFTSTVPSEWSAGG